MTQKVLCRSVWTRRGLERFQRDLNLLLLEGFVLRDLQVARGWLNCLCIAILEEHDDSAYGQHLSPG